MGALLAVLAQADGADNGTSLVQWIPLIGAVLTSVVSIFIAVVNSRGESASLRRLKAMNEVLEKLPEGAQSTTAFASARDQLVEKVSRRITRAVWRRPIFQWSLAALVGLVISLIALAYTLPTIAPEDQGVAISVALISGAAITVAIGTSTWVTTRMYDNMPVLVRWLSAFVNLIAQAVTDLLNGLGGAVEDLARSLASLLIRRPRK